MEAWIRHQRCRPDRVETIELRLQETWPTTFELRVAYGLLRQGRIELPSLEDPRVTIFLLGKQGLHRIDVTYFVVAWTSDQPGKDGCPVRLTSVWCMNIERGSGVNQLVPDILKAFMERAGYDVQGMEIHLLL